MITINDDEYRNEKIKRNYAIFTRDIHASEKDMDPYQMREILEKSMSMAYVDPRVSFKPCQLRSIKGEVGIPTKLKEDVILFYVHGGGLICGTVETSRGYASILSAESHYKVYTFTYRLAPEHLFPAAVNDCFEAYQSLLDKYPETRIVLIGESGGAYLSLTTALMAIKHQVKLPSSVIVYSAPIDFEGAINRSIYPNDDINVTVGGLQTLKKMYNQNNEKNNPFISPINADFIGFPPTMVVWDKTETLAIDSKLLIEKLYQAHVNVEYDEYEQCFHAFPTAGIGTPEVLKYYIKP